ncbi:MAG: tetratricopeptide repeat protein [Pyrinomonadaceae bacterium]|nr:tetratricopeptide repeat protein [Pyrinomonadaceae bacterium]MCX7639726.1 tetratricopeptide repeat protein [Pyrinomonadaceae bacterium]MDW8304309.1 tetratricopeptide repeat protein [Acidobacteriota bacterium]
MNKSLTLISVIAVIVSFIGGFMLASALNRKEIEQLRKENERLRSSQKSPSISDEEIMARIEEADRRPNDFNFQKGLGIALYRYSLIEQETKYLKDVVRLLERAASLNPKDFETQVAIGDVSLDLGQINKDSQQYERARKAYQQALSIKPQDTDIQSSIALTYLWAEPPDYEKAILELKKALQMNPNHERSLENLIRALIAQNKQEQAKPYLDRLKKVNPQNAAIKELESQF